MTEPRILYPRLPLTTRLRLRAEHRVDGIAGWLVHHGHRRSALWLWRACRML